jgi:exopolyphosphatase/guanosine-5'-triphosphate,3'-diphosphate pyrophosphatase
LPERARAALGQNVDNPESGSTPSSLGTQVKEQSSGRNARRGKRKRGGKNRPAQLPSLTGFAAETSGLQGGETRALDKTESDLPPRKKKRRRRSRNKNKATVLPINTQDETSGLQAEASAQSPAGVKRNRRLRGLQGRPLAQKPGAATVPRAGIAVMAASPSGDLGKSGEAGSGQWDAQRRSYQADVSAGEPDDLYAALDLGTNNCRLLIAQPTRPGQFRVVDAFSRIVRLGEGLGVSSRLSQEAMDRSVEALKICAQKLGTRKIRKARLIATEACRMADNGEEFLARVRSETGLELEIIDRQTEARLAVSGCSSLVGYQTRSVVLFDIGGGSSEIAVISIGENRSSRLANHITHWTSLPVGVVTLSERHGGQDISKADFEAMVAEVDDMLARFQSPTVQELAADPQADFHLIGTSGTVTTLAGVHLDLPRYDRRKVDGLWLSNDEVSLMQSRLLSWDFAARSANPCIGPDRADLVLAGCAILESIRRRWPSPRLRVADRGLREGLLTEMMADDGVWRRGRSRRSDRQINRN